MILKFKSTTNELPKDGDFILYIKRDSQICYEDSPIPTFAQCEYSWDDGDGCSCSDPLITLENRSKDYPYLQILDKDYYVIWTDMTNPGNPEIEHFWWMYQEEFDKIWKETQHENITNLTTDN